MLPGLYLPDIFPSSRPHGPGCRLPSTGSLRARFPTFLGTMQQLRLPATRPGRLVSLAARYQCTASFAPVCGRRSHHLRAWALFSRFPLRLASLEMAGPPRFLASPFEYLPCSRTPAPLVARLLQRLGVAFGSTDGLGGRNC